MTAEALQERMRALRGVFVEALANDLPAVAAAIAREDYAEALAQVHKVAGRAGTFGFPEVSDRAGDLEQLLSADIDRDAVRQAMAALEQVGGQAIASARA
jgi:HPt (histidine-containing phosphotransfer) domain-containing protein